MLSTLEPVQRHVGAVTAVLEALETVACAPPSAGPQHEGEKTWIRERLARKRSAAEREQQQQQKKQYEERERMGQQSPPSLEKTAAVRGPVIVSALIVDKNQLPFLVAQTRDLRFKYCMIRIAVEEREDRRYSIIYTRAAMMLRYSGAHQLDAMTAIQV